MDEHELILKTLQGDEQAFAQLVSQEREKIFRHCIEVVRDEAAAEDLTQEAFVHAYQHLKDFKQRSSFSTWVWRIAHNLCLNYIKKEKRRREVEKKEEIKKEKFDPSSVRDYLQYLPQKHRVVFEMYYFEGLSQKEIGKRLNVAHGTIRSRLYYAKRRLRNLLKEL